MARVVDGEISGDAGPIPVRIYEPTGSATDALDVLVFLHGGGWVIGDLETADTGARALAAGLGVRVVSVHYRLAPEHPFPAAFDDAMRAIAHVAAQPTTRAILVAGESAGANLAAATALRVRDQGGPALAGQILINPLLDASCTSDSHRRNGADYGLTTADVRRFLDWYLQGADPTDPRVAPLHAPDLAGVAPCLVVTAGFDPLLDDGSRYARRLIDAGVAVTYLPMPAMVHGWWCLLTAAPAAGRELERLLAAATMLLPNREPAHPGSATLP